MLNIVRELCEGGFSQFPVAVVGDIMLDHYVYGDVNRISPEAPVPVLNVKEDKYILGGAGNVVMNLRGLGLPVKVFGRIGNDHAGKRVMDLFKRSGVDTSGIWLDGETILKTRLLGGGRQQMLRIDREEILSPSDEEINVVLDFIENSHDISSVILSDYGKGLLTERLCTEIISICEQKDIPVFIDPKGSDWERYRGAAMVTPNLRELCDVSKMKICNEDELVAKAGSAVRAKYGLDSLLVTRSERGATYINENLVHHERARAVDVYDVSGAGDTMLATVAAFITAGVDVYESIKLGNAASQVVIGKVGTYPIKASELLDGIDNVNRKANKILSMEEAVIKVASWKEDNEKVVFTNGCFDVFHAGHLDSLIGARNLGDRLIVGLNSDDSIRRLKGSSRPINDERARARVLDALSIVDCVVIFNEETPEELLSFLTPDVIAKGGDYTREQVAGKQYAKEVVILPILEGYSTTSILRRISDD
ncbi:MAG: bifunctional heptose 7-phosphate kinase/heptose 1-phosphate adenyltransferase [Synergistaceae bacterium]|nr:bifunctional heptose 7-phosphate kinase/heptose 1-phosphate adenyltransferase [Synergistaceae bacterium]